jgi:hypothetical protein
VEAVNLSDVDADTDEKVSTEVSEKLTGCKYLQCPYRSEKCSNVDLIEVGRRRVRCSLVA